jgi:hypothetical protein
MDFQLGVIHAFGSATVQGRGSAASGLGAVWADTFTFAGPAGEVGQFAFDLTLHGSVSSTPRVLADGTVDYHFPYATTFLVIDGRWQGATNIYLTLFRPATQTRRIVLDFLSGSTASIGQLLQLWSDYTAGEYYFPSGGTSIDVTNTATLVVTPLTAGFSYSTASGRLYSATLPVEVDVKPGSSDNSINPASNGVIPVAIIGGPGLDVNMIDVASVEFGPSGAPPVRSAQEDVNVDGHLDLVLHFKTAETSLSCGDTLVRVSARLVDDQSIQGSDAIVTTGCK